MRIILADLHVKPGWARQALLDEQPEYDFIKTQFLQIMQLIKILDAAIVAVPVGKKSPKTKPAGQIGRCKPTS
jgi:hypothetical protein